MKRAELMFKCIKGFMMEMAGRHFILIVVQLFYNKDILFFFNTLNNIEEEGYQYIQDTKDKMCI